MDLTRFQSVLEAFEEDAFFMSSRSPKRDHVNAFEENTMPCRFPTDLYRRPLRRVRRPGVQALAGDGVAGPRADVIEVELPASVFLLGPAGDQRSPLPEFSRSGEHACLGGALDDDLEPYSFHRALRQSRVLEAREPFAPDFHGLLNVLRAFLPHFLDHVLESRLVIARQDDLVACIVHVDLVQYRGHGDS